VPGRNRRRPGSPAPSWITRAALDITGAALDIAGGKIKR